MVGSNQKDKGGTCCPSYRPLLVKTPYPKPPYLRTDQKLTILIALWLLDKIVMAVLFYLFQ